MQTIQNLTPNQQEQQALTDKLVKLVFQGRKTFTDIAKELGVSRITAYTYWNNWKLTEEAQQVDWEWWNLYRKLKRQNPAKALECLTRIKYRMTTEKHEVKAEIKEFKVVCDWSNKQNKPAPPVQQTTTDPTVDN